MAFDFSTIPNVTDAEILATLRYALAMCALGKSYTVAGRVVTREDIPALQDAITLYEQRSPTFADGQGIGFGTALSQFPRPV